MNAFIKSIPWYGLVPSGLNGMKALVTSGGGTANPQSVDYVAAAATPDGALVVAYIPPAHSGAITLDMTALSGSALARWFDPSSGTYSTIGTFPNTGMHTFTPTGNNSSGYGDWVLVLTSNGTANAPPTVATAASATPNPVTATTTNLGVLGSDDGGEGSLTYTWAATGTPPAAVGFSPNGTNAAKNTVASFGKAGAYVLEATIADALGQTAKSSVNVTVNQTLTSVAVSPSSASVSAGGTQQFAANGSDQFGLAFSNQPVFAWTLSGGGTITSAGLFTAGTTAGGPFTVTASGGGKSGTASVTVTSGFSVKINFQAAGTATPAGYVADTGLAYGDRGNGFVYGWNVDNTAQARERNAANSPDKRYDTLNQLQRPANPNAVWEIAVPNGTYRVRIVAGDPSYFDSTYALNAETVLALSGTPSSSQLWFDSTVTVTVSDGRLTLSNAAGSVNNKIDFVEIN